jgi:pilus assembly protein CpaE
MGQPNHPLESGKEQRLRLPAPLTVLAASEQIDALKSAKGAPWLGDANLVPLELNEDIAETHLAGAGILVVHVDPAVPSSMRRIEKIRTEHPSLPQIVALQSADLALVRTLVREGVSDVVSLPLQPEELLEAAVAVLEVRGRKDDWKPALAPLIAVTRSLGGGGATTAITHLAAQMAEEGKRVCLFDLDIQFGRVAEVLGLQPRRTLTDLLEGGVRIDPSFLQSVAAHHSSGLSVVAAPQDIVPIESVDASQIRRALEIARRENDFVFVDMPSSLTNWSLSILAEADSIVMLVEQNLASLRQAKRRLDLFRSVGIDGHAVSVVVNRMEKRLFGSIGQRDVEQALGHKVLCGLHADSQNMAIAQDQGLLVNEVRAKNSYSADVGKLASMLRQQFAQGERL